MSRQPENRPDLQYPKMRGVEVHPAEQDGEPVIYLQDPQNIARHMLVLPPFAFFMVTFFDGNHTVQDIQDEVKKQFSQHVPEEPIWDIILKLDEELFLESKPYFTACKAMLDAFNANPVRPAAFAGLAYEDDPQLLRNQLDVLIQTVSSEKNETNQVPLDVLIAPHIDIRRGGIGFAHAYKEIAQRKPADLYIIFGTAHHSRNSYLTVTKKTYDTPLGRLETDVDFINALSQRAPVDLFAEEILHRDEHSIEFQALWLRHILGETWKGKIVPILCGSFHSFIENETSPTEEPELKQTLEQLRHLIATYPGNICIIAGVDFSHVGKRFGSEIGIPPQELERVANDDKEVMEAIVTGSSKQFFETVQKKKDRNHLCGLSPIFMALDVARPSNGRLLHYDQAIETDTESVVSFASISFCRDDSIMPLWQSPPGYLRSSF
jgi:MEMO1 family protein